MLYRSRLALGVVALTLALTCAISDSLRSGVGAVAGGVARALGVSKPELALLPVALILLWVAIDVGVVLLGLRVKARSTARQAADRVRALEAAGIEPPEQLLRRAEWPAPRRRPGAGG
jgi:hypothetical protein